MGFFVEPIKVQVQDQAFGAVIIGWDGVDPSKLTARALAKELCLDARFLVGEVLLHDTNEEALDQFLAQSEKFARDHKRELLKRTSLEAFFGEPEDDGDDASAAPELPKFFQMRLRIELGFPIATLELDFSKISGIVTRLSMDKATWDQCRVSQSKISMRNKAEVDSYKDALKALLPKLKTLEAQIASADKAAEAFRTGAGKPALNALALLAVTHEMTTVYAQQDAGAARLVARTKDLVEIVGVEVAKDAKAAIESSLKPLLDSYKDRDFSTKLRNYFEAWDASHVYYFETVTLRAASGDAKDFKDFDKRLFKAIGRTSELLGELDSFAVNVADELDAAAQAVWQKAVVEKLVFKSRAERVAKSRELLEQLLKNAEAGWTSTVLTWSGLGTTAAGNMEGPPSVLALILKFLVRNEKFAQRLGGRDGMLRAFVLVGVDAVERDAILTLLKSDAKGAVETARTIYANGSWRSPSVFNTYTCVVGAVLILHLHVLANKVGEEAATSELVKATLPVVQDMTTVLLIGATKYYSREMGAYLRSKGVANLEALNTEINRLEKLTPAAKAARVAHVGLTGVTLILSIWTAMDDSIASDKFEDRLLKLSVVGAAITFIGAFAVTSWIGPVGIVIGFVVAAVLAGYQTWFKPKFAIAMQAVTKTLLGDAYLKSKGAIKAGEKTSFFLFVSVSVTLEEMLEETVEQLNDFPWASKLDPKHLVDYARAGLPVDRVAELYDLPVAEIRKRVNAARLADRKRQFAAVKSDVLLVRPGTLAVTLVVGAVNEIKLEVTDPNRDKLPRNIWLEVAFENPSELLADNGQTPATTFREPEDVVMLFHHSSTRFGRVYEGSFRLNLRPSDGKARFEVFVPADPFAVKPEPGLARATVTKELIFDVAP